MLTQNASGTIIAQMRRDRVFARGALSEAVTVFLGGEPEVTRLMLRDFVNGTLGFEKLADLTGLPPKCLHRMLSSRGNPAMDNSPQSSKRSPGTRT